MPCTRNFGVAKFLRLAFENADEFLADDLALLLRVSDAFQGGEKLPGGIHRHQFGAHLLAEGAHHLFRFPLAQQTGIHENSHLLVADGLMHQRGSHRRVHAPADRRQDAFLSNLGLDPGDTFLDDGRRSPVRCAAANVHRKMLEDFRAIRRVLDFGMELHGEILALKIAHRRDGAVAAFGKCNEPLRHFRDPVAVRHPDLGQHIQHRAGDQRLDLGRAVFALGRWVDLAAEGMHQQLHPVADPKDRQAELEDIVRQGRRALGIDRGRSAGKDEAFGLERQHLFSRSVPGEEFAVDVRLAHPAGDQLGVLGTEIEDGDGVVGHGFHSQSKIGC